MKSVSWVVGRINGGNAGKHLAQCLIGEVKQNGREGRRQEIECESKLTVISPWLSSFSLYHKAPICSMCGFLKSPVTSSPLCPHLSKSLGLRRAKRPHSMNRDEPLLMALPSLCLRINDSRMVSG